MRNSYPHAYVGPVLFEPDSDTVFPDRCLAHILAHIATVS